MKTLTLIICTSLIFVYFGCMENPLIQPETNFTSNVDKNDPAVATCLPIVKEELKLCCELNDPLSGRCELHGCVLYIHTTLSNTGGFARIQIEFNMNSEIFTRMIHIAPFTIKGCSCDTVIVNEMGVAFLEKNYEIKNRPDIRLGVNYKVTLSGAEIIGTRLHQIDQL